MSPELSDRLALERFAEAWSALGGGAGADAAHGELVAAYRERHRAYHTLEHIDACLRAFDEVRARTGRPAEVEMASLYLTDHFHGKLKAPARRNLAAAILKLREA